MPTSAISSKGQVTIPKEIREEMGLHKNAITTNYRSLRGMIKSPHKRPVAIREMNDAIARGYAGLR